MTQTKKRALFTTALGAVVVPLLIASFAYACTSLATLSVNPSSAPAGTTVNGTGKNFSPHGTDAPSTEPVVLHLNSRTGTTLWSGRPDAAGNISFAFTVPDVEAGSYTLIATQMNATGGNASGTPARISFQVTPSPAAAEPAAAAPAEEAATPAPAAAAAPAPAATPARAATPRVRVAAPARTSTPAPAAAPAAAAPAPAATPAPAVETPAPVAAPAPAVTPAPEAAPATAPARRSVMVSMSGSDDGSPVLAIALVGVGLVLALGASALVLAGRRDRKAPASARR